MMKFQLVDPNAVLRDPHTLAAGVARAVRHLGDRSARELLRAPLEGRRAPPPRQRRADRQRAVAPLTTRGGK
jgi:hypothetical protein